MERCREVLYCHYCGTLGVLPTTGVTQCMADFTEAVQVSCSPDLPCKHDNVVLSVLCSYELKMQASGISSLKKIINSICN